MPARGRGLQYHEAMQRFGKDNPDIRFGMELQDITELAGKSGFQVFESTVAGGGHVRGINASGLGDYSRKQLDELTELAKKYGAKGLGIRRHPCERRTAIIIRQVCHTRNHGIHAEEYGCQDQVTCCCSLLISRR